MKREIDADKLTELVGQVYGEVERATSLHGPMHSAHEAYGIMAEEFHEFFLDMISNNHEGCRAEAVQIAAMAVRFLYDSDTWKKPKKKK